MGIAIPAIQQLSGVNAIMYYAPTMFESQGSYKLILTFVTTLLNFLSTLVSVFVSNKLGRRFLFIYGSIDCAIGLLFSTIGYTNPNTIETVTYTSKEVLDWMFNGGVFFFISAFGISHGPVWCFTVFMLAGFILQRYYLLHGVTSSWVFSIVVTLSAPYLLSWIQRWTFGLYFTFMVLVCLISKLIGNCILNLFGKGNKGKDKAGDNEGV
jgi:SP family arabinose:H+ symporter-like MFS transporter